MRRLANESNCVIVVWCTYGLTYMVFYVKVFFFIGITVNITMTHTLIILQIFLLLKQFKCGNVLKNIELQFWCFPCKYNAFFIGSL